MKDNNLQRIGESFRRFLTWPHCTKCQMSRVEEGGICTYCKKRGAKDKESLQKLINWKDTQK